MNLALLILSQLNTVHPLMMDRTTLLAGLRIAGRTEGLAEIDGVIRLCETDGQLITLSNADAPGGKRYQITDHGRARLAQANLL